MTLGRQWTRDSSTRGVFKYLLYTFLTLHLAGLNTKHKTKQRQSSLDVGFNVVYSEVHFQCDTFDGTGYTVSRLCGPHSRGP